MNWNKIQPEVKTSYVGHESRVLQAGDRLQFRCQPEGESIETFFDEIVPEDKQWTIEIKITAIEKDE